jgi:hypothetical protein
VYSVAANSCSFVGSAFRVGAKNTHGSKSAKRVEGPSTLHHLRYFFQPEAYRYHRSEPSVSEKATYSYRAVSYLVEARSVRDDQYCLLCFRDPDYLGTNVCHSPGPSLFPISGELPFVSSVVSDCLGWVGMGNGQSVRVYHQKMTLRRASRTIALPRLCLTWRSETDIILWRLTFPNILRNADSSVFISQCARHLENAESQNAE